MALSIRWILVIFLCFTSTGTAAAMEAHNSTRATFACLEVNVSCCYATKPEVEGNDTKIRGDGIMHEDGREDQNSCWRHENFPRYRYPWTNPATWGIWSQSIEVVFMIVLQNMWIIKSIILAFPTCVPINGDFSWYLLR